MNLTLKYTSEKKDYFKDIIKLIKKSKKKVCYVTLNKSCGSLIETFKKNKIDTKKVYVIDGISALIEKPKHSDSCSFIPAPYDLDKIKDSIKQAIENNYTFLIFDSLSNLLIYKQTIPPGAKMLGNLINSFSKNLEKKKGKAIFFCKSKDKGNLLIQETLPIFSKGGR